MTEYMRESGRIRSKEKSFNVELAGDPDPQHVVPCTHGWYHTRKTGIHRYELCVKCGRPKADCETEVQQREEARQAEIRKAQEASDTSGVDAFGGTDAGGRARGPS